jgi:hypothetical protein
MAVAATLLASARLRHHDSCSTVKSTRRFGSRLRAGPVVGTRLFSLRYHDRRCVDAAAFEENKTHRAVVLLFAKLEDVEADAREKAQLNLVHVASPAAKIAVHAGQGASSASEWDVIKKRLESYR